MNAVSVRTAPLPAWFITFSLSEAKKTAVLRILGFSSNCQENNQPAGKTVRKYIAEEKNHLAAYSHPLL